MPTPQEVAAALSAGNTGGPQYGFPSPADVAFAQANDAAYGTPYDAIMAPGFHVNNIPSLSLVKMAYGSQYGSGKNLSNFARPGVPDKDLRDRYYANYLASLHSPVAALGMDPSKTYTTINPDKDKILSVLGFYGPGPDQLWWDNRSPSTMTHESTHAGFQQLRDAGMPAPNGHMEELYVRALMNRHFKDSELIDNASIYHTTPDNMAGVGADQIAAGKALNMMNPRALDKVEQEAEKLYHKRDKVMGPR